MSQAYLLKELRNKIKARFDEADKKLLEAAQDAGMDIDLLEPASKGWIPPDAGDAPQEVKDILKAVYSDFRDKNPAEDEATKTKGSKIAWGAVHNAGWSKNKEGKWVKKVKEAGTMTAEQIKQVEETGKILDELLADIDAFINKAETGIKGKLGSPAVRQFLREVKSKLKTMVAGIKQAELKEKAEGISSKIEALEAALDGSFEDITDKVRAAIKQLPEFPEKIGDSYADGPWIKYMFPDRTIVSYNGKLYEISFAFMNDIIITGQPKEVIETYVVKEVEKFEGIEVKVKEAVWDSAYIDDLPDSSFAYIEPTGKKGKDGRTEPRSLRHLPYKDASGKVDRKHLANARARLSQTGISASAKGMAMKKLDAAAKQLDMGEFKESGKASNVKPNMDIEGYVSLKEAQYDAKKGEVVAVLIEAGTNYGKRRHYPKATVESAAPIFSGLKMYINHPTKKEEQDRPERDLRDWAATITESWADNGKALGRITVHDKWLKDLLEDPVARANIGLSINARGKSYVGKIDGQDMQIIEKICEPKSVDWVTEPGARGRVVQLFESHTRGGGRKMVELESVSLQELKESRPDLYEAVLKEGSRKPDAAVLKEAVEKAVAEATEPFLKKDKISGQKTLVEKWLASLKIHEAAKKRCLAVADTLFESEAKLKEAFDARVKEEVSYISAISGKKGINGMGDAGSHEGDVKESQSDMDAAFGVKAQEKKEADK